MGGPTDMDVGVFWKTSVVFLKSVASQLFSKYSQSYINLNVKSNPEFNGPWKNRQVVLTSSI